MFSGVHVCLIINLKFVLGDIVDNILSIKIFIYVIISKKCAHFVIL